MTHQERPRRATGRGDERGMVAVWTAAVLVAFIVIVGIGVDFAGHARTTSQARSVAAEAARAGGQHLVLGEGRARPDVHQALAAAQGYVAASGMSGSARVSGGTTIQVEIAHRYETQFLSIIRVPQLPVNVTAAADVKSTVGGVQR